jgi:hypothetical protein
MEYFLYWGEVKRRVELLFMALGVKMVHYEIKN